MRGGGARTSSLGKTLSPLAWLGVLLGLAAWCLLVGSLSSLQNGCNRGLVGEGADAPLIASLNQGVALSCRKAYRYQWFIIMFELFVLFLTFVALVTRLHRNIRVALVGLTAIATLLLIELTNRFLILKDITDGKLHTRVVVFFVGALVASIANMLIILGLGSASDDDHDHHDHKYVETVAPVHAGTTAPAGTMV